MQFLNLNPAYWRNKRAEYLAAARKCRDTLTDPNGFWQYAPGDVRVANAVAFWLQRASNAHDIAVGREPVIADFVYSDRHVSYRGPLYVGDYIEARAAIAKTTGDVL